MRRLAKLILAACTAALLFACAGVLSPHVKWDHIKRTDPMSLGAAMDYADKAIDTYNKALRHNAVFESGTGIAFLVLSAGALGNGITGGREATTAWLGLAGGTSYGLGNWLTTRPRRTVYAAGVGAMTCVKQAMIPYEISAEQLANFRYALAILSDNMDKVRSAADATDASVTSYQSLIDAGNTLSSLFDQAADLLIAAVDRVGSEVDDALASTSPDLAALKKVVDGLAESHRTVPVPPPPAAGAPVSLIEKATFVTAQVKCATAQACALTVRGVLSRFSSSLPIETLKNCGVDGALINPLEVTPDPTIKLAAANGMSAKRYVRGGSGRYLATILTIAPSGPEIKQPSALGPEFEVSVSGMTAPGIYDGAIIDASNDQRAFFKIEVTKAP